MDLYYDITSELDAREILRYLNQLGIHNISGEVLKSFITDLKKLIKYELTQSENDNQNTDVQGPERLHSASTFASRLRSKSHAGIARCGRECPNRRPLVLRNIHSAPVLRTATSKSTDNDKPLRRTCSCVRVEKKIDLTPKESKTTQSITMSNNLIKVPKVAAKKKCDPVSLYHYYTALWAKYKQNVPGENDWAELRWSVRQRMAAAGVEVVASKHSAKDGAQGKK